MVKKQISTKYNPKSVQFRTSIAYINERIKAAKQMLSRKEYIEQVGAVGRNLERNTLEEDIKKLLGIKETIKASAKEAEVQMLRDSIDFATKAFKPELIKKIAASYKVSSLENDKDIINALKKSLNSID